MEKRTIKILIGAIVIAIVLLIICLAMAFSGGGGGGGGEEPVKLPGYLNSSLCPSDYGPRPLLLVSLDGFRANYLQRDLTPTIQKLADMGVHAEYMMPSFPTVTFPNHYTIVTGLYPEAHGIIGNSFYDPVFKSRFSYTGEEALEGKWWGGEPIWNTITRQSKKSATYFWPGSEADINKKRPTYWKPYNGSVSYEDRVMEVLEWLDLKQDQRPSWISLYLDEPDHAGHSNGPDSAEVNKQLTRVDKIINLLMKGLVDRNLINCVNIIILADHGMVKAGKEKIIDLMKYVPDLKQDAFYRGNVVSSIDPKNDTEEVELEMLRKLVDQRDEMRVYLKEGLPKRLHFANNRRIEDIVIELDPGFTTQFNSTWSLEGQHGYDNYFPSMNALFMAYGPDFKQYVKIQPFQNIELYNLMCHLTNVTPAENNGTLGSLHHLLANPPSAPPSPKVPKPQALQVPSDDLPALWNMSGCSEEEYTPQQWMLPLTLNERQERDIEHKHLPWGIPQAMSSRKGDMFLLYHPGHVTGFGVSRKMPLWTSFTMTQDETNLAWGQPKMTQWTSDVRLPKAASPLCETFNLLEADDYVMFTLFPTTVDIEQSGEVSTSYMVTNAIPVHSKFKGLWIDIMNTLPQWIKSKGPLNILMGPVFDSMDDNPQINHLIQRNISIPSDLFIVLTHCLEPVTTLDLCHPMHLDTRSFILHQYRPVPNVFKTLEDYLIKFSATVRDVEHSSHLKLFPNLPFADRVNHTLRVHTDVWPMPLN